MKENRWTEAVVFWTLERASLNLPGACWGKEIRITWIWLKEEWCGFIGKCSSWQPYLTHLHPFLCLKLTFFIVHNKARYLGGRGIQDGRWRSFGFSPRRRLNRIVITFSANFAKLLLLQRGMGVNFPFFSCKRLRATYLKHWQAMRCRASLYECVCSPCLSLLRCKKRFSCSVKRDGVCQNKQHGTENIPLFQILSEVACP